MSERRGRAPRPRPEPQSRFSIEGLLAVVTELGSTLAMAGTMMLIGGFVVFLTVSELRTPGLILMYLALFMFIVAAATHPSAVKKALTARTGRYATNTIVMTVALFAILVLAGFVSYENAHRFDVTATRQFTLAPQTKKVVDGLQEPVRARAYFDPSDARQELIKRRTDDFFYEFNRRNRDFSFEFIDPDLKPSQARADGVTEYPTIVFEAPDSDRNPYRLTPIFFDSDFVISEQDLVSALLISTGEKQKAVYLTTGHNELNMFNTDEESNGFGYARNGLLGDNYQVFPLNLKEVPAVPADAAVLVVAGPTGSFLVDERDKIDAYLRAGGRAVFLLDEADKSQLNKLLNNWGVNVGAGTIVDVASSVTGDPRSPILRSGSYNPDHAITKPLDDSFFTEAAAIQDIIKRAPEGLPANPDEINITLTPLAASSRFSCTTTDRDISDCSGDGDIVGPHPMAMVIEARAPMGEDPVVVVPGAEGPLTSIVVFGDSDFASNRFYFALNNSDFFLNAVGWLAQKYDIISIRAKPQAFRLLIIDQDEFDFIRYSSWFLLPTSVMLLAGIAWWRRR